jgi:KAP family P-loop domain
MLADVALADEYGDRLGFKPFADALAGIIDSPRTATPLVVAINAKWGAGKTTLGKMIKRRLETKSAADGHAPHVTCWFAAWMHDDAAVLSTALAADIAQVASSNRSLWRRILFPLPSNLSTAGHRKFRKGLKYLLLLVFSLSVCTFVAWRVGHSLGEVAKLDPAVIKSLISLTGGAYLTAFALAAYLAFHFLAAVLPVAKSLGEFAKDPRSTASTASMQEVRSQLGKLIKRATPKGSKFVIFIDDLDRCRPPRSVDILEAVNQLFDHTGVIVVIMSDMQVVARCAEIKYKDLVSSDDQTSTIHPSPRFSTYGWAFLQKIVQLQFDLPVYPVALIRQMIEVLAKEVPEESRRAWWSALPPFEEQEEITRRVDVFFKLADAIERRVSTARARTERLTRGILAKAFRGELVPTEAELARSEGRAYESASDLLARIRSERPVLIERKGLRRKNGERQTRTLAKTCSVPYQSGH